MDDQKKTADARAALLESGDEDAQKAVLAWEKRNPHEDEVGSYLEIGGRRLGPFYTFGEISLKNRASWIRDELDALHDQVIKGARSQAKGPGRSEDVDQAYRDIRSTQCEALLQPAGSGAFDSARRFSRRRFRARAAASASSLPYCRKCSGCAAIQMSGKSDVRSPSIDDRAISN